MATIQIGRRGFAQVEPNHLSGIVTGQILAQLSVDAATMGTIIENGRFAKYDYATGKVNLTGSGEWMLIYNEEKLYDERKQSHKDFAMIADSYTDREIVPRLISTVLGDIYTTNAFGANTTGVNSNLTASTTDYDGVKVLPDVAGITIDETGKDAQQKIYQFAVTKATGYLGIIDTASGADNSALDLTGPIFELAKIYRMADGQPGVKLIRVQ